MASFTDLNIAYPKQFVCVCLYACVCIVQSILQTISGHYNLEALYTALAKLG